MLNEFTMHMQTISDGCAMLVLVVSKGTTDNTTHYNHIRLTARAQDSAITSYEYFLVAPQTG